MWHDSFICVTWLIHMCDITHSYVWHDSFICVTWLIHMCDITHAYVWHDSFICVTWLIHMCDMTHSYVWHDSFLCVSFAKKSYESYAKEAYTSCKRVLWISVSSGKETRLIHRALLHKRPDSCMRLFCKRALWILCKRGVYILQKSTMNQRLFCKRDLTHSWSSFAKETWLIYAPLVQKRLENPMSKRRINPGKKPTNQCLNGKRNVTFYTSLCKKGLWIVCKRDV